MSAESAALQMIDDALGVVLARLAEVNAKIAELTAEAEVLKDDLRKLAPGDWTDATGRPVLRLTPTRKFDPARGMELIPDEVRSSCLTVTVDPSKVKQHLTPTQLDECMVEAGKPKVSLL